MHPNLSLCRHSSRWRRTRSRSSVLQRSVEDKTLLNHCNGRPLCTTRLALRPSILTGAIPRSREVVAPWSLDQADDHACRGWKQEVVEEDNAIAVSTHGETPMDNTNQLVFHEGVGTKTYKLPGNNEAKPPRWDCSQRTFYGGNIVIPVGVM